MKKNQSIIDSAITGIENANIFKLLSSSFSSCAKSWPFILLSVLIDLIFVVSVSMIVTILQFSLFDHLEALMRMAGEATGGLMNIYNQTMQVTTGLTGLSNNPEFQMHLTAIFKYLGIMVLSTFALWVIFQGLSWYLAYRISTDKRQSFLIFWKNFVISSIPFYFLTIFWIFISVKLLISIKMSIAPFMGEGLLNALFAIAVIITWYFGALCYTITGKYAYQNLKSCFVYGTKKFFSILPSVISIVVLFFIIDLLLKIPFIRNDQFVMMIVGTILFMPFLVFARVLLFKTREHYLPEKK